MARRRAEHQVLGLVAGLLLIGVGVVGLRDILTFLGRSATDALGITLILGAAALALITAREALNSR